MNLVSREIKYIGKIDGVILGSRSGVIAAGAYAVIKKLGFSGYQEIAKKSGEKRIFFKKNLKKFAHSKLYTING